MKDLFPQFPNYSEADYKSAWDNGRFCFDANILLNFYRYREDARNAYIQVLEFLTNRIWLPHQAALEFHRNRLDTIVELRGKPDSVSNAFAKTIETLKSDLRKLSVNMRNSLIQTDPHLERLDTAFKELSTELTECKKKLLKTGDFDPIRSTIESLFEGKVGLPFLDQSEVDKLNLEAEERYKHKIPPGYKDEPKGKDDADWFRHNNITYKKRFGDFLLWRQLLRDAKEAKAESVIFVTEDSKSDWWSVLAGETAGPRQELLDEACQYGIRIFLMYDPARFLEFAKQHIDSVRNSVSESIVDQVRDVSLTAQAALPGTPQIPTTETIPEVVGIASPAIAHAAAYKWLASNHSYPVTQVSAGVDFVIENDNGGTDAFEVRAVAHPRGIAKDGLTPLIERYRYISTLEGYDRMYFLWAVPKIEYAESVKLILKSISLSKVPDNFYVIIGLVGQAPSGEWKFAPLMRFQWNEGEVPF